MNNSTLTLALMAGLPGTGKSTIAGTLGSDLKWDVIDKDGFKDEFLQQGDDHETASRRAYKKSFDKAREELTQHQTSVILDSAVLDHFTLDEAIDIVCSLENIQLKVILCVTSRESRIKRIQNKRYSRTKLDPATKADYLQIFEHLPLDRLELDTDEPLEKCLEKAREYLIGSPAAVLVPR